MRHSCPACTSFNTEHMLDMGNQPMSLVSLQSDPFQSEHTQRLPILLRVCRDCQHVFNSTFYNAPVYSEGCRMYNDGVNWQEHMSFVREKAESHVVDTVIEIGAGDCEFLNSLRFPEAKKIAVDPSQASAIAAEELGIQHYKEYFDPTKHIPEGADNVLVIMRHLLEHLNQPREFIKSICNSGSTHNTYLLIEVPSCEKALRDLRLEDWTYEHPQHFTVSSMNALLRECKASKYTIDRSYNDEVLVATAIGNSNKCDFVDTLIEGYRKTEDNITRCSNWMFNNLDKIAFWGGAGKSAMFLNKFQIPNDAFVVDSHREKWDMYVPGTAIKIRPPKSLFNEHRPIIIATTSWRAYDIREEIIRDHIPCRCVCTFNNGDLLETSIGS